MQVSPGTTVDGFSQGREAREEYSVLGYLIKAIPANVRRVSLTIQNTGTGISRTDFLRVTKTGSGNGLTLDFLDTVVFEPDDKGRCEWTGAVEINEVGAGAGYWFEEVSRYEA